MAAVHISTFQVRYCDCDAYGHMNNANYLRYMQEAAFDASAAVGYDQARYQALGSLWLARETEIEYLQALCYPDRFEVKTWVDDFRRVRSRRLYEFHRPGETELVARASTDWVYLDADSGRPITMPPEMIAAFAPDGDVPPTPPRKRFPPAPSAPPGVFKVRRRVEWRDIDTAMHVNNAAYLNYIEDCGIRVAAAYGWPLVRCQAEGFLMVARRHHIEYRHPAYLDDELEIATWASDRKGATALRHYTVTRLSDGEVLALARTVWVWVDRETGRPIRIPAQFVEDFAPNLAE
jgi:acyl-CoA thioester hydrolase